MYQLFNENCIEGMKRLSDDAVDLTVTSPPYDNLRTYNGHVGDFDFAPTAQELYRVTQQGGVVVWIVNDATINGSETGTSFKQALYFKELGFNLHDTMIYQKSGCPAPEINRYYPNFEYMFVFSKGKPKTVHLLADRKNLWAGDKTAFSNRQSDGSTKKVTARKTVKDYGVRWNVWQYSHRTPKGFEHPATFPLELAQDHIKSWSSEGDTVLDCFAGSGTTGVACVNLNRNFIGFEIDKGYCDMARERIARAVENCEQSLFGLGVTT